MTGAEWIKWRKRLGYSQERLAAELGVARQTIIAWEREPTVSRIAELTLHALEQYPDCRLWVPLSWRKSGFSLSWPSDVSRTFVGLCRTYLRPAHQWIRS